MLFSRIWENFPRVFHPPPFSPNVDAGFLKSFFLISPNFQFSTPLFPNNHGPPTRVRCERVLFFPDTCHNQLKTHEPTPTQPCRAPPPMWRVRTCLRFELGDMSPSPPVAACHRHAPTHRQPIRDFGLRWQAQRDTAFARPSNPANPTPSLAVGRGGRPQGLLDVSPSAPAVLCPKTTE